MEKDKQPSPELNAMVAQGIEQARGAVENYLRLFENNMAASPWAGTALNKKVMSYAEQNIMTAFGHAQKLAQAKDLQEVARLQTEFFQAQLKSLTEQAKDIGETAAKAAVNALKTPTDQSS